MLGRSKITIYYAQMTIILIKKSISSIRPKTATELIGWNCVCCLFFCLLFVVIILKLPYLCNLIKMILTQSYLEHAFGREMMTSISGKSLQHFGCPGSMVSNASDHCSTVAPSCLPALYEAKVSQILSKKSWTCSKMGQV